MAQLAIKGHKTRGKEVIELLEMLGGRIMYTYNGDDDDAVYFIDGLYIMAYKYENIDCNKYIIFTLEEFLKKYPYKVGDKVQLKGAIPHYGTVYEIEEMRWEDNQVKYIICDLYRTNCKSIAISKDLQLYKELTMEDKELTMEEKKINQMSLANCDLDEVEIVLGDKFEMKIKDGKYYAIRKKPQYPKTYDECCNMYGVDCATFSLETFKALRELIYCRNSYWKIAGEQMELGKPWEPDWKDCTKPKYTIHLHCDCHIFWQDVTHTEYRWLSFPTSEMRDTFYDNFKDLIEQCKELL